MAQDTDSRELKLISVGHYLWKQYKANRQNQGIESALTIVWNAKRQLRLELAVEQAAESEKIRQRFKHSKTRKQAEMVESYA